MKTSKLEGLLEEVKGQLGQPVPPHTLKERKMVKKVEKGATKAKGKADAKPEKSKAKSGDDNLVTLADLAAEAKISGAAARRKIRATEMDRGEGRWAWPVGSKQLRTTREALGLK